MIGANRLAGNGTGGPRRESQAAAGVSVRLVDPGEQPLQLLGALFEMGCPPELAYDYLEASVVGREPEVLVGAEAAAAVQLAETLRQSGATVVLDPPLDHFGPAEPLPPRRGPFSGPTANPYAEAPAVPADEPTSEAPADTPTGPVVAPSFGDPADRPSGPTIVPSDEPRTLPSAQLLIEVVERYIGAYNAGNEARLVGCLSASAVLSDATGQVLVEGASAIGRRMAEVFAHYPDGRVTVMGRQVAGPWALDHHRTTYAGGASEETVLCFRVDGGVIDRLVLLTMT